MMGKKPMARQQGRRPQMTPAQAKQVFMRASPAQRQQMIAARNQLAQRLGRR